MKKRLEILFVSVIFGFVFWGSQFTIVKAAETKIDSSENQQNLSQKEPPFIFQINNKKVEMSDPIIQIQGRNFIPAEYFYNHIEKSSGEWISDQVFHLNIAGNSFVFFDNHLVVFVNNIPTRMDVHSFVNNGKMYVPVHFIVNSLGGHARYKKESKELLVYLDEYLFKNPRIKVVKGEMPDYEKVPNATLVESRDLMVSDNPETLTHELVPENESTLSMYHVQTADKLKEHRVFGWHLNELGNPVTIGITIENTSSSTPIEVTPIKEASAISDTVRMSFEVGLKIVDALVDDKSNEVSGEKVVIQPGETKVIESFGLNNGRLLGFSHDMDIRAVKGDEMDYKIRTVLSKSNGDLTAILTDPVPTELGYPRGAWEYSAIEAVLPEYTVGSPIIGYGISNGKTDYVLTEDNSISPSYRAVGNIGHYGADYKVKIPVVNPSKESKQVFVRLSGKGGIYSGAVKFNGQTYLIPDIKPGKNYAELPAITVEGGRSETIELDIMHAGGSFLPLAIYVESK